MFLDRNEVWFYRIFTKKVKGIPRYDFDLVKVARIGCTSDFRLFDVHNPLDIQFESQNIEIVFVKIHKKSWFCRKWPKMVTNDQRSKVFFICFETRKLYLWSESHENIVLFHPHPEIVLDMFQKYFRLQLKRENKYMKYFMWVQWLYRCA